jgi:dCTP deaminase
MVLSAETIRKYIEEGKIKIEPFNPRAVGAVSVDLRLGNQALDPDKGKQISLQDYHLSLDEFLLVNTIEKITLPGNLMARLIPRSSLARLGVLVTFDADLIPPNYSGKPILTMKNLSKKPVLLGAGLSVCQILFEQVDKKVAGYRSRYRHDKPEKGKLEKV